MFLIFKLLIMAVTHRATAIINLSNFVNAIEKSHLSHSLLLFSFVHKDKKRNAQTDLFPKI